MLPPHITLQWQPLVLREPPNQWQLFFFHFHYSWCIHITLLITGRQPLQFFERSQGKSPHLRLKLVQLFFLMVKSHPWMLRHLSHVIKKNFSCWKEKKKSIYTDKSYSIKMTSIKTETKFQLLHICLSYISGLPSEGIRCESKGGASFSTRVSFQNTDIPNTKLVDT